MKLQITIEMGNAAFQPEEGLQYLEVARMLREYAVRIENCWDIDSVALPYDANGNRVGEAVLID